MTEIAIAIAADFPLEEGLSGIGLDADVLEEASKKTIVSEAFDTTMNTREIHTSWLAYMENMSVAARLNL